MCTGIYVSNESLLDESFRGQKTQVSDIRYGNWSAAAGLTRGPIFPSSEIRAMEDLGATVYEHLLTVHEGVPFRFTDTFELWLLDKESRPLVLIDSAPDRDEINLQQPLSWTPGLECRSTFVSSAAKTLKLAATASVVTDYLCAYVNDCAGPDPAAQLFERTSAGPVQGLAGINLDASLLQRQLAAALVEARLRDILPEQHLEEVVLPPFCVELDAQTDS